MKKLFCIFLSFSIILSLSACSGDKKDKDAKKAADLKYYASIGRMPEAEYSLGTEVDKVKEELSKRLEQEYKEQEADPNDTHGHDENEFFFEIFEGENNVLLDNGHIRYYYCKAKKDKGIGYIVNYDTAFGFKLGTVISEIKSAYPDIEFYERPLSSDNAFFADYVIDGTVLSTKFDGATISFVFQENELFATAIFYEDWSVTG